MKIRIIVAATLLLCLSACSPKLRSSILVPTVPEVTAKANRPASDYQSTIYVDEIKDARPSTILVEMGTKESTTDGDVGLAVKSAISKALQANQFGISDSAPVVLSGEVRRWHADVHGGLPSSVKAEAEIYIEVFDPANKKIYSGTYQGDVNHQESSLEEEEIRQVLGQAMSEAVGQIISDRQLINLLGSF